MRLSIHFCLESIAIAAFEYQDFLKKPCTPVWPGGQAPGRRGPVLRYCQTLVRLQ